MIEAITEADIPALVEICRVGHQESRYSGFPFAPDKVARTFGEAARNPAMIAVKCVVKGEIGGFFVGAESAMEFSNQPIGVETSFLVKPAHRGSRCALLLVWAFRDWCDARKMPCFVAIHYAMDNEKTYRFIERMGMNEIGRIFARGL